MRDRLPTPGRENRVKITQDDGTVVSGVLEYDDQATQEGSPYTKGNVLPDTLCNLLGIDPDSAEPKDAWLAIPGLLGMGNLTITVSAPDGTALEGIPVSGISGVDASRCITNSDGVVSVFVDAGTYNIGVNQEYFDMSFDTQEISVSPGEYKNVSLIGTLSPSIFAINASRQAKFTRYVSSFDVFCVGGGGGGGGGAYYTGGGGGGGGHTNTALSVTPDYDKIYSAQVGAGGASEKNGGTTSFDNILSASGGTAGQRGRNDGDTGGFGGPGGSGGGGGNGWYTIESTPTDSMGGSDGGDGMKGWTRIGAGFEGGAGGTGQGTTTRLFGEAEGTLFSGGGGGGARDDNYGGTAGSGGGGAGGVGGDSPRNGYNGQSSSGGGGGGGGGTNSQSSTTSGGSGGSGVIYIRWVSVA